MIEHKIDNTEGILNTFIITIIHDKYIERCLKTLTKTVDMEKHRIILIEAPSANPREIIYPLIEPYVDVYIKTKKNYGFSKSVNMGMSLVFTPYFTVVHDDCWFIHRGWWDEIMEILKSDKDCLMLQPAQRNRRDEILPEFPSEKEYQKLLKTSVATSLAELYCMVFKKEWIDLIGFFDESIYPIGPEDVEFYRLATSINKRIAVSNKVVVFHKGAGRQDKDGGGFLHEFKGERNDIVKKWGGINFTSEITHGNKVLPLMPNIIKQL